MVFGDNIDRIGTGRKAAKGKPTMKPTRIMFAALAVFAAAAVARPMDVGADHLPQHHLMKSGGVTVEAPWARATATKARTGAAFMTLRNATAKADRLIAVKSAVARKTELHQSLIEGGIMKMRHVRVLDVPAGGMAVLKPGGHHVMFIGLKSPLREGTAFPLTLVFETAGEIQVTVKVMKAGAQGSNKGGANKGGMPMKHAH